MIKSRAVETAFLSILASLLVSLSILGAHSLLPSLNPVEEAPTTPPQRISSDAGKRLDEVVSEFKSVGQGVESWVFAQLLVYAKPPPVPAELAPVTNNGAAAGIAHTDAPAVSPGKHRTRESRKRQERKTAPTASGSLREGGFYVHWSCLLSEQRNALPCSTAPTASGAAAKQPAISADGFNLYSDNETARIALNASYPLLAELSNGENVFNHVPAAPAKTGKNTPASNESAILEIESGGGDDGDENKLFKRMTHVITRIMGVNAKTHMLPGLPSGATDITININDYLAFAGFMDHGEIFNRHDKPGAPPEPVIGAGGGIKFDFPQRDDKSPAFGLRAGYSIPIEKNVALPDNNGIWHINAVFSYRF